MRATALLVLGLTCAAAVPASAGSDIRQHCTLQVLNETKARALFGTTAPYEFDIIIDRPNQVDRLATAASLSGLAQGDVREDWVSPGGVGFKYYATAHDGSAHWFGVHVNRAGDIGELADYGQAGRQNIGTIFTMRCERLDALNGRY